MTRHEGEQRSPYSIFAPQFKRANRQITLRAIWDGAGARRAGVPHARIKNINIESARSLPGVIAVLTCKDIRGSNRQGVIRKDQPVLADDRIRHCGDAVALVLAEEKAALRKALDLISIDLEPLPGIFDLEKAMEEGAAFIHDDSSRGNVLLKGELETGSGEAAFEECDDLIGLYTWPITANGVVLCNEYLSNRGKALRWTSSAPKTLKEWPVPRYYSIVAIFRGKYRKFVIIGQPAIWYNIDKSPVRCRHGRKLPRTGFGL